MAVSVFDLFSIGIGPSSSHTVGPMRAATRFTARLAASGVLHAVDRVRVALYGSLAATGTGHGTIGAVILGLTGADPETVDPSAVDPLLKAVRETRRLTLAGGRVITFDIDSDIAKSLRRLDFHSNGMAFAALGADGAELDRRVYYSVGGGAVVDETEASAPSSGSSDIPYPFSTATELVALAVQRGCSIATVMADNERALARHDDLRGAVLRIWSVMQQCVAAGLRHGGVLPGGLGVRRRAGQLAAQLEQTPDDPLYAIDWVTVYALAVNEENASGGRVVTAPTNGAAGVIPAVLHYYTRFVPGADDDGVVQFLLTAAAIGVLFKANASISGAEVGCQGEVGSACSMAAAGLTAVLGGTPAQVENAAEIGIEHNLGLTCDPVRGLVQIPCIERNAVAAVKAITAARMAMHGDGSHFVSLDTAIKTMRDTGADMADKYKETALGGLALNVVEC
ncbi:L-serine ammonia-lyase [Mycobacterium sp. CVI_P3]|uniref:L-serine dehydratase n=1 Tax=Mycobacterium pinniadriaticum TaxID=2994102 RepID=A0ABT3S847_9MYCO|nr:L-serine ammonia-lyase [Mycobacterium pinniadriaticum]MCX2929253.1 L-serine ammonia-lyase [Mycobacterium pinniadriaticum]MCX2935678.1 L-serine ammonia-lyase [Mycobacterium pinniadriaticum]